MKALARPSDSQFISNPILRVSTLFAVVGVTALFAMAIFPLAGQAYVYFPAEEQVWSEGGGWEVKQRGFGRANLDGTGSAYFLKEEGGASRVLAVAGSHVYWIDGENLARSDLDGSNANREFIKGIQVKPYSGHDIADLAIAGEYVYWYESGSSEIARIRLNGTELDREFITGLVGVTGLTTYGNYLYWTSYGNPGHNGLNDPLAGAVIGKATLGGTEVDRDFVGGINVYCGTCVFRKYVGETLGDLAVNKDGIYFVRKQRSAGEGYPGAVNSIGEVSLAGTGLDLSRVLGFRSELGAEFIYAIAATDSNLYWVEWGFNYGASVGRFPLASGNPTSGHHALICTLGQSVEISAGSYQTMAVDSGYSESNEGSSDKCLLAERVPEVRLDSQESYHPADAEMITEIWGDKEHGLWYDGYADVEAVEEGEPYSNILFSPQSFPDFRTVVASPFFLKEPDIFELEEEEEAGESITWPYLLPGYLGSPYPDEWVATENDWVELNNDYVEDSQAWDEANGGTPSQISRVYGHLSHDESGKIWLQYWLYYYNNDAEFLGTSIGSHEGDWEVVQVGLDENGNPDAVVFSQHETRSICGWNEVDSSKLSGGPVVYVAGGTHANYPYPGDWNLPSGVPETDRANGEGMAVAPSFIDFQQLEDREQRWPHWPGKWGGTSAGAIPGEANSPPGPMQHSQWADPGGYAGGALECDENFDEAPLRHAGSRSGESAELPAVDIERTWVRGDRVRVRYEIPAGIASGGARLLISLKEAGDATPRTAAVPIGRARGVVEVPFDLVGDGKVSVLASLVDRRKAAGDVVASVVRDR